MKGKRKVMKFCNKCGNQLPDTAMFCPKCGNKMVRNKSPSKSYGREISYQGEYYENRDTGHKKEKNGKAKFFIIGGSALVLIAAIVICVCILFIRKDSPQEVVEKYLEAINNNDAEAYVDATVYKLLNSEDKKGNQKSKSIV